MQVKTKAIVLSALKFQDKNLIVKCFTESDGLKSYFIRGAFSTTGRGSKAAYFQPLTILDIEAVHKNKGTLETLKEFKIATPFATLHHEVTKSTIVLFLSEMLHHSIREEERNAPLFAFLETALDWFDHHDAIANFHLILLLEVTKYLGFYPDVTHLEAKYFEMTEGVFSDFHAISSLSENETGLLRRLMALKFDDAHKAFHVSERQALLKILVDYYAYHLEGFRAPQSLEVLREIFS